MNDEEFLEKNKSLPDVTTLSSGLQYKILKSGNNDGNTANINDIVEVHYYGKLINGKEFDSSYKRGKPIKFPVNGVIPGWTEALQLMKEGDIWELYIPSDLAYGKNGAGEIGPNATLIFKVELLKIRKSDNTDGGAISMMKSVMTVLLGIFLYRYVFETTNTNSSNFRAHNFSAGPASLPLEVLKEAHEQFFSHDNTGMNIMEQSHRDKDGIVQKMIKNAENDLHKLLDIPKNYRVLFMHGGAHAQFAAVPLNLNSKKATYIVTGYWSDRAMNEAKRYTKIQEFNGVTVNQYKKKLIHPSKWKIDDDSDYVYFCASETIDGLEFLSEDGFENINIPIVADFTSTLLSREIDISKYGIIFASGGKNLGPSGYCVVIIREDLILNEPTSLTPSIMNYYKHANSQPIMSIYNTPPTYPLYLHSLVLKNLKNNLGGVSQMEVRAKRLSEKVFKVVDNSNGFYVSKVSSESRSRMNVPLRIMNDNLELEKQFVREASEQGLLQLFGHPVKGGLRVTLYNGIREESVDLVCEFMKTFANKYQEQ